MVHVQTRSAIGCYGSEPIAIRQRDSRSAAQAFTGDAGDAGPSGPIKSNASDSDGTKTATRPSESIGIRVRSEGQRETGERQSQGITVKILIIEDQEGAAVALKHFLEPLASEIQIAKNMAQAMQIVSDAQELDLITLDLGLPDSDIDSTRKKIKEIKDTRPDSLIVVVTGHDIPDLEKTLLQEGADGFIFKMSDRFSTTGFLQILAAIVQKYMGSPGNPMQSIKTLQKVSAKLAQLHYGEAGQALVNENLA
jgi:CheY-like chemotaxis protein